MPDVLCGRTEETEVKNLLLEMDTIILLGH